MTLKEFTADQYRQIRLLRGRAFWTGLIIVGTLLMSALLASVASIYVIIGLGVVIGLPIVMRWPILGLGALIFSGLFIPFGLGTGTQTSLNMTVLLVPGLLALWILQMIMERRLRLLPARPMLPAMLFVVVSLLAFGIGQLPWFSALHASMAAQIGGLSVFIFSIAVLLLMAHQVSTLRMLEGLTWLFIGLGSVLVISQVLPPLSRAIGRLIYTPIAGGLFWVWLAAMTFGQVAFNKRLYPVARALLGLLLCLILFNRLVQNSAWTSGWLPGLAGVGIGLWVGAPRVSFLVAIGGGVGILLKASTVFEVLMGGDNGYSFLTRLAAWQILADIIKLSPVLGLGPSNYHWYTTLFPILGWYVPFNSHNNYVDIVAQTGILGLICFLWLFAELGFLALGLQKRVSDGFARGYLYGVIAGLAGTLVAGMFGDWVIPFVYNVGISGFRASVFAWLFLGGLIALARIMAPEMVGAKSET